MFKPIIPRDKTSFNYEERKNPETRPFSVAEQVEQKLF